MTLSLMSFNTSTAAYTNRLMQYLHLIASKFSFKQKTWSSSSSSFVVSIFLHFLRSFVVLAITIQWFGGGSGGGDGVSFINYYILFRKYDETKHKRMRDNARRCENEREAFLVLPAFFLSQWLGAVCVWACML